MQRETTHISFNRRPRCVENQRRLLPFCAISPAQVKQQCRRLCHALVKQAVGLLQQALELVEALKEAEECMSVDACLLVVGFKAGVQAEVLPMNPGFVGAWGLMQSWLSVAVCRPC